MPNNFRDTKACWTYEANSTMDVGEGGTSREIVPFHNAPNDWSEREILLVRKGICGGDASWCRLRVTEDDKIAHAVVMLTMTATTILFFLRRHSSTRKPSWPCSGGSSLGMKTSTVNFIYSRKRGWYLEMSTEIETRQQRTACAVFGYLATYSSGSYACQHRV